jgi:membrane protease YdiL (CAAX protease family)
VEEQSAPVPVPWHRADLAIFVVAFAGAMIIVPYLVLLLLWAVRIPFAGPWLLVAQGLGNIAVIGFVFFIIRLHGKSIKETLRWIRSETPTWWLISAGVFLALSSLMANSFFPPTKESPLEQLLETPASIALLVIYGITIAPITEEVMFRGFVFAVVDDLYGARAAVAVTTIAFAGMHFWQLWGNWAAMVLLVIVGYVLTKARERTNSLIAPLIMHIAYNSLIFGASALSWLFQKS